MDMKDSLAGGSWPYPSVYQSYDAALAGYHFNGYLLIFCEISIKFQFVAQRNLQYMLHL